MCGSGKSIVTEFFEKEGFSKVYFGGITMEQLKKSGQEVNEQNERRMRESLREKYGMGAYAQLSIEKIDELIKSGNVIIDGLYSWSEYKILSDKYGDSLVVVSIASPRQKRYERLATRHVRPLSNSEARARDYAEIENLEKGGPIAIADYTVCNDGTVEALIDSLTRLKDLVAWG